VGQRLVRSVRAVERTPEIRLTSTTDDPRRPRGSATAARRARSRHGSHVLVRRRARPGHRRRRALYGIIVTHRGRQERAPTLFRLPVSSLFPACSMLARWPTGRAAALPAGERRVRFSLSYSLHAVLCCSPPLPRGFPQRGEWRRTSGQHELGPAISRCDRQSEARAFSSVSGSCTQPSRNVAPAEKQPTRPRGLVSEAAAKAHRARSSGHTDDGLQLIGPCDLLCLDEAVPAAPVNVALKARPGDNFRPRSPCAPSIYVAHTQSPTTALHTTKRSRTTSPRPTEREGASFSRAITPLAPRRQCAACVHKAQYSRAEENFSNRLALALAVE